MKKKEEISEYDQQAIDFLKATGATIQKAYAGHRPYWDDEKKFRATYMITITREGKPAMAFQFGQSMVDSWKFSKSLTRHSSLLKPFAGSWEVQKAEKAPSDYTILSSLTKYDPYTFDDFCNEYGYDTDSRKAETTYQAVRKEYQDLSKIFTEAELDQMAEIQ